MSTIIKKLPKILKSDTMSEAREKINSISTRVDDGEFSQLVVTGNARVEGTLNVFRIVSEESFEAKSSSRIIVLSDPTVETELPPEEQVLTFDDGKPRGIFYNYYISDVGPKLGFFGQKQDEQNKFTFIPDVEVNELDIITSGEIGELNAKIDASNILNPNQLSFVLASDFISRTQDTTISGTKTFTGFVNLTNPNQGQDTNDALPARRGLIVGDGILIDGASAGNTRQLTRDRVIAVAPDVVRTFGNQTITGIKSFDTIQVANLQVTGFNFDRIVYEDNNQNIVGEKIFRPAVGQDGILLKGRAGGSGNFNVSIETSALTENRVVTLPNSNVTITPGVLVNTETNQTITSQKTFTKNIVFSDSGTSKRGITGVVGTNDFWFFGASALDFDDGFVEISSGDNGNEPIYVRQYSGSPLTGTLARSLTLLDGDGNTSVPQNLFLGSPTSNINHAVRADREITAGDGLTGGGNLTENITFSVTPDVVRTAGNFTLEGSIAFLSLINGISSSTLRLNTPVTINNVPFDGSQNITIDTGAKGGGTNQIVFENDIVVTESYTITTGKNGMSAGPIEILEGVVVTVPNGSTWVIV
jgi:hypothetical protein